jgi:pimeloyl-ACP methyl ester carboxylesterase
VTNLILWEELSDVVLCGHSYGGAVIRGVADRISDRIGALVYLDAFVLQNGQLF